MSGPSIPATLLFIHFGNHLLKYQAAANIYNMDEVGCDSNKARVTKVMRDDQLFHNFEDTDGDHTPFHVTNALTTCANGTTPIPPFLIHSNPTSKAHGLPKVTKRCVPNITPQ